MVHPTSLEWELDEKGFVWGVAYWFDKRSGDWIGLELDLISVCE